MADLDKLVILLKEQPRTAAQIALFMGCSKPAAYRRVRALKREGVEISETKAREGATGPEAVFYGIQRRQTTKKK